MESGFDWLAKPPRQKLFKIIPYKRPSSSFGYSQAVKGTWKQYKIETGNKFATRSRFKDSVDFIGWYTNKTEKILKVSKKDAFKQYVAYHEGWGNFKNYKNFPDFIQKYIFPGGMLPSIPALEKPIIDSGLKIEKIESFGKDYASTLSIWRKHFNTAWPEISKLGFDNKFYRMWNLYFSYCEGGFRSGSLDVKQIKLSPAK